MYGDKKKNLSSEGLVHKREKNETLNILFFVRIYIFHAQAEYSYFSAVN